MDPAYFPGSYWTFVTCGIEQKGGLGLLLQKSKRKGNKKNRRQGENGTTNFQLSIFLVKYLKREVGKLINKWKKNYIPKLH